MSTVSDLTNKKQSILRIGLKNNCKTKNLEKIDFNVCFRKNLERKKNRKQNLRNEHENFFCFC